jgi:hypothetical protein
VKKKIARELKLGRTAVAQQYEGKTVSCRAVVGRSQPAEPGLPIEIRLQHVQSQAIACGQLRNCDYDTHSGMRGVGDRMDGTEFQLE